MLIWTLSFCQFLFKTRSEIQFDKESADRLLQLFCLARKVIGIRRRNEMFLSIHTLASKVNKDHSDENMIFVV